MSDVLRVTQLLGAAGFEVVTPDALVSQLQTNVFHDCSHASPATGSFQGSCTGCQDSCGALTGCKCGFLNLGDLSMKTLQGLETRQLSLISSTIASALVGRWPIAMGFADMLCFCYP